MGQMKGCEGNKIGLFTIMSQPIRFIRKTVWSDIFSVRKRFWSEKIWVQNFFRSEQYFVLKICWSEKNNWSKKS